MLCYNIVEQQFNWMLSTSITPTLSICMYHVGCYDVCIVFWTFFQIICRWNIPDPVTWMTRVLSHTGCLSQLRQNQNQVTDCLSPCSHVLPLSLCTIPIPYVLSLSPCTLHALPVPEYHMFSVCFNVHSKSPYTLPVPCTHGTLSVPMNSLCPYVLCVTMYSLCPHDLCITMYSVSPCTLSVTMYSVSPCTLSIPMYSMCTLHVPI